MCRRDAVQCIIPPYVSEHLARSENAELRERAEANLAAAARARTLRARTSAAPSLIAPRGKPASKHRLLYDARNTDKLPGVLVRSEGDGPVADPAVNEAFDHAGSTWDFYDKIFKRNSLDGEGLTLVGTVHLAESGGRGRYVPLDNAFWDGTQMAYGDGDGVIFQRFTRSLDVVGHELTHGVQSFTSNLEYEGQSGALNEHFADVFGALVRQWKNRESAAKANWLIGKEVLVPAPTRRGVRDMEHPGTAFTRDPYLGTDPQPAHMSKLYEGQSDNGGVHLNSGIPNRAFVLAAKRLGGNAWETAGRIWYDTMLRLPKRCEFQECAELCVQVAAAAGADAAEAVRAAWAAVGVTMKVYA
ncbi:MAG TPA: M4 family metallopeptidase [Gemmatimonadaceae bacterium]|nr:M4 family metallopeptidase [Gemmatimonadaceae bacterium]